MAGRVRVRHDITSSIPVGVDQIRVTAIGRAGTTKSVAYPEDVELSVPGDVREVRVEYLEAGVVVDTVDVEIDLSDGKEDIVLEGTPTAYVSFVKNDSGYQIKVGTQKLVIRGVGFDYTQLDQTANGQWFGYVQAIAPTGANCIRLYGLPWTDSGVGSPSYQYQFTSQMLAHAARNNLYVLVGVYVDGSATTSRVSQFVNLIQNDANFNRVIGYCVGNEVAAAYFPTVNSLASTIKTLFSQQPSRVRPIMSAFPAVSSGFVSSIKSAMPNLDWIGVNTFSGSFDASHSGGGYLNTQAQSLSSGGWAKPWAITEYYSYDIQAPDMPNQVLNGASKGYMLELNSTANAQNYANSYTNYIVSTEARSAGSVGGFVLNFGAPHNSKLVASWLEPFMYVGRFTPFVNPPWSGGNQYLRLAAVDAVTRIYGGTVANPCPQIVLGTDGDPQGISCSFKATLSSGGVAQAGGASVQATVVARDAEPLTFAWYLVGGSAASGYSGDITAPGKNPQAYEEPTTVYVGPGTSTSLGGSQTQNTVSFTLPTPQQAASNNYQLRVVVSDPYGGAATAAIGFPMQ